MRTKPIIIALSTLVVLVCLWIGSRLSEKLLLWTDEIYTQVGIIEKNSYIDLVLLKSDETSRSPLFYLIQKTICDITNFHFPFEWKQERFVKDVYSQRIMRFSSNVFMSLTIGLIFLYFAFYYSYSSGVLAILMTLSSYLVWSYWVEARPYSLWILLTVSQVFLFMEILKKSAYHKKLWLILGVVHIALSMTIFLSIMQILAVSVILWFCINKDWKSYWWITVWPVVLNLFFFFKTHNLGVNFVGTPQNMINLNFSLDRLIFVSLFAGILLFVKKSYYPVTFDKISYKELEYSKPFFLFTFVMLAFGLIMLFILKMIENGLGSCVHMRHWLFLTPISIIATTLAFIHLGRMFRDKKLILFILFSGAAGILWLGFSKVYVHFLSRVIN